MEKHIRLNDRDITIHGDGSVDKLRYGKIKRTFGSRNGNGYRRMDVGGTLYYVHRLVAMAFLPDYSKDLEVDHIDGVKSNNRPENLRMVNHQDNIKAYNKPNKSKPAKTRGVVRIKGSERWQAYCRIDNKKKHLGYFGTAKEAAIARDTKVFSLGYPLEGLNYPELF